VDQFQGSYNRGQVNGDNCNLEVLAAFLISRFNNSVMTNSYFFNDESEHDPFPLSNPKYLLAVSPQIILRHYHSVRWSLVHNPSMERIPDNFYKRTVGDEYTTPFFMANLLAATSINPQFLSIGRNTGTPNSFTGVDPRNIATGIHKSKLLTEGDNLACFAMKFATHAAADLMM